MKVTTKLATLIVALGSLAMALGAPAQQPIVIKFSHVVAVDTPKGKGAEYFKKLAEERTKGRVKVEVYPNSTLYKDGEEMDALQLGLGADAGAVASPNSARSACANSRCSTCRTSSTTTTQLHKVTDGPVGQELFAKLETKGITGLAYWDNGFKDIERQQAAADCRPTSRA